MRHTFAELIGEEIYDEFDPQGHPDLSSYAQADVKVAPSLKRTPSAPQLAAQSSDSRANTAVPADVSKATPVPSVLKPKALPALRSLNFKVPGFQRSRSAPPMPPDAEGASEKKAAQDGTPPPPALPEGIEVPPSTVAVVTSAPTTGAGDGRDLPIRIVMNDESLANPISPAPVPVKPSPLAVTPTVVISTESVLAATSIGRARTGGGGSSGGTPVIPVPPTLNVAYAPPSRSASPAPSLEQAILVERKRRAQSASGSQYAIKGGWFKSSPLNGGDRAGVIVAERVKRDMQVGSGPSKESCDELAAGVKDVGGDRQQRQGAVGAVSNQSVAEEVRKADEDPDARVPGKEE